MVPVTIGLVLCGVKVSLLFATQYENCVLSWVLVMLVPAVVKLPLVCGSEVTKAIEPVCLTVAEHVHPPSAESTQDAVS
jgi:hypothetical protein